MQTITLEITNANAFKELKDLENKHFIKILDEPIQDSPTFPGNPMSLQAFKKWISEAETSTIKSLASAKSSWQSKKQQLEQVLK